MRTLEINDRYQTTDLGSSENTKQDKFQHMQTHKYTYTILGILYSNCRKLKKRENLEIIEMGEKILPIKEEG